MSLKTEYGYNEDDFIEQGGELKELTVTITLCEYRNLIETRIYNEKTIEILQEQNEKLKEQNNGLSALILKLNPKIVVDFANAVNGVLNLNVEQPETEETTE